MTIAAAPAIGAASSAPSQTGPTAATATPTAAAVRGDPEVLDRLVNTFADAVPGVSEAVLAGRDGCPVAASSGLDQSAAESLAAMAMGLAGLGSAAADRFGGGRMSAVAVDMDRAQVLISGCGERLLLAVVVGVRADAAHVAAEMQALAGRIGGASGGGYRS